MGAPEVIKKGKHTTATDIWSMGVIIYNMITGEIPFQAKDRYALMMEIMSEKLVLRFPEDFPSTYRAIIKFCLLFDPSIRPTARELLDAPEKFVKYFDILPQLPATAEGSLFGSSPPGTTVDLYRYSTRAEDVILDIGPVDAGAVTKPGPLFNRLASESFHEPVELATLPQNGTTSLTIHDSDAMTADELLIEL